MGGRKRNDLVRKPVWNWLIGISTVRLGGEYKDAS
jgi:hypothetical protein